MTLFGFSMGSSKGGVGGGNPCPPTPSCSARRFLNKEGVIMLLPIGMALIVIGVVFVVVVVAWDWFQR